MHDDWQWAGRPATPQAWWDGQKHSWAEHDKEECWHDQIGLSQAVLEEELGYDVIKEGQHECVQNDGLEAGLAAGKLKGWQGQEHAWAEHAKQEGWEQNLGSSDVNHSLCYYLPRKEMIPWEPAP